MEAVSRGASEAGGKVIGVVARSLSGKANRWVQETIVVEKWEERLLRLIAIGNGYVACPGGTGTLVELAVAWEMRHKRPLFNRPLIALGDFWRPVIEHMEAAEPASRGLVQIVDSVAAAVEVMVTRIPQQPS